MAVGIDVHDGHGGAHGGHLRHDVIQLRVERRAFVLEVDAGALGDLGELEAVARERIAVGAKTTGARAPKWRIRNGVASRATKTTARSGLA